MARLYEYVPAVLKMTREEFVDAHRHPFLLLRRNEEKYRPGWTFKTQTISTSSGNLGNLVANDSFRVSPEIAEYEVHSVAKARDNPWPERVSIGRARNNDVVLADTSVSKLHAHFRTNPVPGAYTLVDAGSRNGTHVNETRLEAGSGEPVQVGDTITFGRTTTTFIDSAMLYELVTQHVEETK
jgi:pSer/pThr/pTyr-binding forkhead associated (FHA) protein